MPRIKNYIPYLEIPSKLNIQKGDIVVVSSNIIRFAYITQKHEGIFSPKLFIDKLQEIVGQEGTLLFHAFNFNLKSGSSFDIRNTQPKTTGSLALAAFKRGDFKRTKNPLHSFLVWGKHTNYLLSLNNKSSFGADSPFTFLKQNKAKKLSIDIDLMNTLTFTHHVEELAKVKYRYWKKYLINYTDVDGNTNWREYYIYGKRLGYVNVVNPLLPEFIKQNAIEQYKFNTVAFNVIDLEKTYDIIHNDLQNNEGRNVYKFSFKVFVKNIVKEFLGR